MEPGAGSATVWCLNYGSYTQDWEVQIDGTIGGVSPTGEGQQVDLNLKVMNNDNWNRDTLEINFKVDRGSLGTHRAFHSHVAANYVWLDPFPSQRTSVQSAGLRVTFEAATKR